MKLKPLSMLLLLTTLSCLRQPAPVTVLDSAISLGTPTDQHASSIAILSRGKNICSGTLIAPKIVLTAAHCLISTYPDQVFVGSNIEAGNGQFYPVESYLHNLNFENKEHSKYDYGYIKLQEEVEGITTFPAISDKTYCLTTSCPNTRIQLAGFGYTQEEEELSLAGIHLAQYNKRKYVVDYPAIFNITPLSELITPPLLAGGRSGDSGGGLLLTINQETFLIGIVSRGISAYDAQGNYTPQNVFSLASNAHKWYISQLAVNEAESLYGQQEKELAYKIIDNEVERAPHNGNAVVTKARFMIADGLFLTSQSFLEPFRLENDYAELYYISSHFEEGSTSKSRSLFRSFLATRRPSIGIIKEADILFKNDQEIRRMIFNYLTSGSP